MNRAEYISKLWSNTFGCWISAVFDSIQYDFKSEGVAYCRELFFESLSVWHAQKKIQFEIPNSGFYCLDEWLSSGRAVVMKGFSDITKEEFDCFVWTAGTDKIISYMRRGWPENEDSMEISKYLYDTERCPVLCWMDEKDGMLRAS
jgi:hypothetical protein